MINFTKQERHMHDTVYHKTRRNIYNMVYEYFIYPNLVFYCQHFHYYYCSFTSKTTQMRYLFFNFGLSGLDAKAFSKSA